MKWKHKIMGWVARTPDYVAKQEHVGTYGKLIVNNLDEEMYVPTKLIVLDSNWEEIVDDRWLDKFQFTVRQFMEAFAMTISESGGSHDSAVAKGMVDNLLDKIHHNTWVAYNPEPIDNFSKHKTD